MFFLDLKRADVAIRSGRLDEAFELLQNSSERSHRDGQVLVDRLTDALLQRVAEHLNEGRLPDARHDGNKLLQLAGRKSEVAQLLQRLTAAEQVRSSQQQLCHDALATVQQQVNAGAYSMGAKLLDPIQTDHSVSTAAEKQRLAQSIEARREIIADAVSRIQTAIDANNPEAALDLIMQLQPDQQSHRSVAELVPKVIQPLVETGWSQLASGRLDRAASMAAQLQPLQASSVTVSEFLQSVARCWSVKQHLAAHRFAEAESELAVLQRVLNDSDWIGSARAAVADAILKLNCVLTGPLGLLDTDPNPHPIVCETVVPEQPFRPRVTREQQNPPFAKFHSLAARTPPERYILQVDALGGMLLLTSDLVSIGVSTRPTAFDVALMTEGDGAAMTLRRDGDDYFAESANPFLVNGQAVTRTLLTSGDTLAVGTRGRLRFMKPVAASASAVLQITGSRLARRDIRSVVLLADSLLFGPTGSHFRLPAVNTPIVLHRHHNQFALRPLGHSETTMLRTGESVVMNETRFRVEEA